MEPIIFDETKIRLLPADKLPLISVVIPNYNHGEYIHKAVDSVFAQGLTNFEIIIVDDASTDDSYEIIKRQYSQHPQIRIFQNSSNLQTGGAKNKGLDEAKGKYVFFIDSDDWIDNNTLIHMASIAETHKVEIVACGMEYVHPNGTETPPHLLSPFTCTGGLEALELYAEYKIPGVVVEKLYLKEFLTRKEIRFQEGYLTQDLIFTLAAIYACQSYISITPSFYKYYQSPRSALRSPPSLLKLRSCINLYKQFVAFIKKMELMKTEKGVLIAARLMKYVCTNAVLQKMTQFLGASTQEQWEQTCREACTLELGESGYAFADFIIGLQNLYTSDKQRLTSRLEILEEARRSRTWVGT